MKSMQQLIPYLQRQWKTLVIAFGCMILYALTTAFYAFISGPALKYIFTGDVTDVLKTSTGETRSLWKALPQNWLEQLELDKQKLLKPYQKWLLTQILTLCGYALRTILEWKSWKRLLIQSRLEKAN